MDRLREWTKRGFMPLQKDKWNIKKIETNEEKGIYPNSNVLGTLKYTESVLMLDTLLNTLCV